MRNRKAEAAIPALIIHRRATAIHEIKRELADLGLPMRMNW